MSISQHYIDVSKELAHECEACGRDPEDVLLLAVSKTVGIDGVREAHDAGARSFGENRPDPLVEKHADLPDADWHFIGNIQSRRIKDIVPCASLIHSLYQEKHAQKISEEAARLGKTQRVLVEVNVSGEESKSGLSPRDVQTFVDDCRALPNVQVCGLMTMAPQGDMVVARECFAGLRELHSAIREHISETSPEDAEAFAELSMGMTDDWREAVAEGSTIVRIGRAIFSDF